ncbi:MAG: Rieske 2Fe-2S domain-containing protein [Halioglobus sp.]
MVDNTVEPGSARAPGDSVAHTLHSDRIAAPAPILETQYSFLGDADLDPSRYTSEAFFKSEMEKVWSKSWQWACREEHLQEIGDHYVYDIGDYSVIVVRASEDSIKAFLNVCTHRGTRLFGGDGTGYSQAFTCPFHGWSWELDGSLKNIPARWDFPHVNNEQHSLREVACEQWGGFVFVNIDPMAKPLSESMDVMPDHFKHFPLDRRRIKLHVQKVLPANWKAAQEAFMEAYHNFETHDSPNGANTQYDIFGQYVSRFIHNIGNYSPESLQDYPGDKWRKPPLTEQEILSMLAVEQRPLEAGETARAVAAESIRKTLGEQLGVDFSETSDSLILDSIEYHMFPNMFFFPGVLVPMVYRFRPLGNDVDQCLFDLLILEPLAEGSDHPEPPEPIYLSVEQSYTEVEELGWLGKVYDEDTGNLQLQQQGLKAAAKGVTLGNFQEARIRRVNMTLDEMIAKK